MPDQLPNPDANPAPGDPQADPAAPEALVRELARAHLPPAPIEVPAEVDERVMAMARWRLSQRTAISAPRQHGASIFGRPASGRRLPMHPMASIGAAAAALLLVALLVPRLFGPGGGATPPPPGGLAVAPGAPSGDVDGNGRVDVLDAFALARAIRDGRPAMAGEASGRATAGANLQARWDVNKDGVVDQADVASIAATAVRLAPPGAGGAG